MVAGRRGWGVGWGWAGASQRSEKDSRAVVRVQGDGQCQGSEGAFLTRSRFGGNLQRPLS